MEINKDRENLEQYIETHMIANGLEDISQDEFLRLAFEYFEANPIENQVIRTAREAMVYNRLTGEIDHWKRIPHTELYWRPGFFFNDIGQCLLFRFPRFRQYPMLNPRRWLEYFGLLDPKDEGDYYMYGR